MRYLIAIFFAVSILTSQSSELIITAPRPDSEFERDDDVEIEWTYSNIYGKVILEYSIDRSTWKEINKVDVTDKNYFFELPFENKSRMNSDGSVYLRITQGLTKHFIRIIVPKIAIRGGMLDPYRVPSDDDDIADDLTLDELDFDDFNLDAPPPPPSGPKVVFIPYDDPPVAITPIRPIYPKFAQMAGIEGVVIVQAFIDANGRVKETLILKGVPNTGLDEAAMEAIRKTRFLPAKERARPVGVWISIPVNFKLK